MKQCSKCKFENTSSATYCSNCGRLLSGGEVPKTVPWYKLIAGKNGLKVLIGLSAAAVLLLAALGLSDLLYRKPFRGAPDAFQKFPPYPGTTIVSQRDTRWRATPYSIAPFIRRYRIEFAKQIILDISDLEGGTRAQGIGRIASFYSKQLRDLGFNTRGGQIYYSLRGSTKGNNQAFYAFDHEVIPLLDRKLVKIHMHVVGRGFTGSFDHLLHPYEKRRAAQKD